jgi:hypothetical protein
MSIIKEATVKMLRKHSSEKDQSGNRFRQLSTVASVLGFAVFTSTGTLLAGEAGNYETPPIRYESKFYGTVEKLPQGMIGTWVINRRDIAITRETRIIERHGKAAPGAYVEVEGVNTGKAFTAHRIEVKRSGR